MSESCNMYKTELSMEIFLDLDIALTFLFLYIYIQYTFYIAIRIYPLNYYQLTN